jgi:uncharacterized membrane protein
MTSGDTKYLIQVDRAMHLLKLFAIVLPVFLLIDLLWLGVVMKGFYSQELGELARRQGAALAPRWGAVFGLVLYGVYDLTNLALLEKWTVRMTIADIVWGGVLCGTMSVFMQFADRWLTRLAG